MLHVVLKIVALNLRSIIEWIVWRVED
jgi:hypothetical protein